MRSVSQNLNFTLQIINFNGGFQIMAQLLFIGHNLHGSPAQHKAGANQHGIPDPRGGNHAVLNIGHGVPLRLRDSKLRQKLFKQIPVFGLINSGAIGADNLDTALVQRRGQVNGGLPAQRGDNAVRLFKINIRVMNKIVWILHPACILQMQNGDINSTGIDSSCCSFQQHICLPISR